MVVNVQQAAEILGISPELLRYRIGRGLLKRASGRGITRLDVQDVIDYQKIMPPTLVRSGRPHCLVTLSTKIARRSRGADLVSPAPSAGGRRTRTAAPAISS
jgi:hypothetical protein